MPCTVFKLISIDHQVILIEHDPQLYDGASELVEDVSRAIAESAKKATVLLYSPEADPFFEDLVKNADKVFYFEQGPRSPLLAKLKGNRDVSSWITEAIDVYLN